MTMKSLGVNVPESEVGSTLDFPGFLALVSRKLQVLDAEEDLKRALLCFDQDGSGYVSTEYLKWIVTSLGDQLSNADAEAMMRECDTDNDGRVSTTDVVKVLLKYS